MWDIALRTVITQSNYLPWRGWFAMVRSAENLVFLEDVQYTRRDWRNRNRISSPTGPKWLTIPVDTSGKYLSLIYEIEVSEKKWWKSHLSQLDYSYRQFPNYEVVRSDLHTLFESLDGVKKLSEINLIMTKWMCSFLKIQINFRDSREFPSQLKQSARLLDICEKTDSSTYISGPAARDYLNEEAFKMKKIQVDWIDYSLLQPLPKNHLHGDNLSVIDIIAVCGRDKALQLTDFCAQMEHT